MGYTTGPPTLFCHACLAPCRVPVSPPPLPHWLSCSPPSILLGDVLGFAAVTARILVLTAWPAWSMEPMVGPYKGALDPGQLATLTGPHRPLPTCEGRVSWRQKPLAPNKCPLVSSGGALFTLPSFDFIISYLSSSSTRPPSFIPSGPGGIQRTPELTT